MLCAFPISGVMDLSLHSAGVDISLGALKSNWLALRKAAGVDVAAPIKGDAYGLGLAPCAKALWDVGCTSFYVARPLEGEALRAILPEAAITVLDGLYDGQAEFYRRHRLIPALISLAQAKAWATSGGGEPCVIHVDSGINRLGFTAAEFRQLCAEADLRNALYIKRFISHLACSDEPEHPHNAMQFERFQTLRKLMPKVSASFANSSGIFLDGACAFDEVRPGIALYGGNPTPGKTNPMRTVVCLYAKVLQTRMVNKGDSIGYSATWSAPRDSRIALLGAGYRDGIPRALSSRQPDGPGQVYLGGRRCPIVGRVSMDMMACDVTDVAGVEQGSLAEIFGNHISVDEAAGWADTISYELLTHLGNRYARHYVD